MEGVCPAYVTKISIANVQACFNQPIVTSLKHIEAFNISRAIDDDKAQRPITQRVDLTVPSHDESSHIPEVSNPNVYCAIEPPVVEDWYEEVRARGGTILLMHRANCVMCVVWIKVAETRSS